jgi:hypothetical protein
MFDTIFGDIVTGSSSSHDNNFFVQITSGSPILGRVQNLAFKVFLSSYTMSTLIYKVTRGCKPFQAPLVYEQG